jgi:microcin C transport system ATP-binding protein
LQYGAGATAAEREARIVEALREVDLDPTPATAIRTSSAAASASARHARALGHPAGEIDEPTSALDVSIQAQIVGLLRALQAKHRIAYLFISHDLRVIGAMSHRILVLKDGVVVEQGDAATVLAAPQAEYTRTLLKAALV